MSLNHKNIVYTSVPSTQKKMLETLKNPCIVNTPDVVKVNKLILEKRGQGEGETKWKGWAWKLLLFI